VKGATFALAVVETRVPGGRRVFERDLGRLTRYAAKRAGRSVSLSFAVVDDVTMRQIHADALGLDEPTDVLSFPMAEAPVLEGEIVVSADTARREAAARGHAAAHELMLYAVHGVMHLLGYDDHEPADRRRMRSAERRALEALGYPAVFG